MCKQHVSGLHGYTLLCSGYSEKSVLEVIPHGWLFNLLSLNLSLGAYGCGCGFGSGFGCWSRGRHRLALSTAYLGLVWLEGHVGEGGYLVLGQISEVSATAESLTERLAGHASKLVDGDTALSTVLGGLALDGKWVDGVVLVLIVLVGNGNLGGGRLGLGDSMVLEVLFALSNELSVGSILLHGLSSLDDCESDSLNLNVMVISDISGLLLDLLGIVLGSLGSHNDLICDLGNSLFIDLGLLGWLGIFALILVEATIDDCWASRVLDELRLSLLFLDVDESLDVGLMLSSGILLLLDGLLLFLKSILESFLVSLLLAGKLGDLVMAVGVLLFGVLLMLFLHGIHLVLVSSLGRGLFGAHELLLLLKFSSHFLVLSLSLGNRLLGMLLSLSGRYKSILVLLLSGLLGSQLLLGDTLVLGIFLLLFGLLLSFISFLLRIFFGFGSLGLLLVFSLLVLLLILVFLVLFGIFLILALGLVISGVARLGTSLDLSIGISLEDSSNISGGVCEGINLDELSVLIVIVEHSSFCATQHQNSQAAVE